MANPRALIATLTLLLAAPSTRAATYIVVFEGTDSATGFEVGGSNLLNLREALAAVKAAGGIVTSDMSQQIGVAIASSANPSFTEELRTNPLVEHVGVDLAFQGVDDTIETLPLVPPLPAPGEDPFEAQQWGMRMIHAPEARESLMGGNPAVTVAVLDTGIDSAHRDFFVGMQSNIDVARARSFIRNDANLNPDDANPLVDGIGHGTGVASIIAARKNGLGMVGVAPNVTIVPIKVIDSNSDGRFSWVIEAITYAGDIDADVINMSFAIDATDDFSSPNGEQPWCRSDRQLRDAFIKPLERAIRYARSRGALPVAGMANGDAIGNDRVGDDLGIDADCDVLPAETPGVVATGGLDLDSVLTGYSNYGLGVTDLVAPAGVTTPPLVEDDRSTCTGSVVAQPPNSYNFGDGTSFAAPRVSGVAALIISAFGELGIDGDMKMPPGAVEDILLGSAIDIGTSGNDMCYGDGRVDALRAVQGDTNYQIDPNVTGCLRYPTP